MSRWAKVLGSTVAISTFVVSAVNVAANTSEYNRAITSACKNYDNAMAAADSGVARDFRYFLDGAGGTVGWGMAVAESPDDLATATTLEKAMSVVHDRRLKKLDTPASVTARHTADDICSDTPGWPFI